MEREVCYYLVIICEILSDRRPERCFIPISVYSIYHSSSVHIVGFVLPQPQEILCTAAFLQRQSEIPVEEINIVIVLDRSGLAQG